MCGIAGIWMKRGGGHSPDAMPRMLSAQTHRGPDDTGTWSQDGIVIGHTRLVIIDQSDASAQPMHSACGRYVLTYNGEIHNYLELRAELEAHGNTFRTSGDTEVIAAALSRWGSAAFPRFNGMWALAWWDRAERRLLLSRDRFGIKPLFYSIRGDRIAFASEIKAILAAFPEEQHADNREIHAYLSGGSPNVRNHTFFENVHALAPAHHVTFTERSNDEPQRYWNLQPRVSNLPYDDSVEQFRALFDDAVRLRLRSDVALGAALSGGVDSSSIVAVAAANDHPPRCFSLRYPDKPYDESHYAASVARLAKCPVTWIEPDGEAVFETMARIVHHHDTPPPLRGRLPRWALMQEASRHVRVLLEGAGADELLAGYGLVLRPYLKDRITDHLRRRDFRGLIGLEREARQLSKLNADGGYLYAALSRTLKKRLPVYRWKHVMSDGFRAGFGSLDPLRSRTGKGETLGPFDDRVSNLLWLDFCYAGLPESLHGVDAASMAFSVESRAPFLDHRLVELCFAMPTSHKLRGGWTKAVLRDALRDLLPTEVRLRRQKLGFPAPYGQWLAQPNALTPITEMLLSRRCRERGILDPAWLRRLLGKPERARRYAHRYVDSLWRMTCLELWFRQCIDIRSTAPVPGISESAIRAG